MGQNLFFKARQIKELKNVVSAWVVTEPKIVDDAIFVPERPNMGNQRKDANSAFVLMLLAAREYC